VEHYYSAVYMHKEVGGGLVIGHVNPIKKVGTVSGVGIDRLWPSLAA
jgi:hypothetical protein